MSVAHGTVRMNEVQCSLPFALPVLGTSSSKELEVWTAEICETEFGEIIVHGGDMLEQQHQ